MELGLAFLDEADSQPKRSVPEWYSQSNAEMELCKYQSVVESLVTWRAKKAFSRVIGKMIQKIS